MPGEGLGSISCRDGEQRRVLLAHTGAGMGVAPLLAWGLAEAPLTAPRVKGIMSGLLVVLRAGLHGRAEGNYATVLRGWEQGALPRPPWSRETAGHENG